MLGQRRLVAGDPHQVRAVRAQVHAPLAGRGDHVRRPAGDAGEHGVEELGVDDLDAAGAQPRGDLRGAAVRPLRDRGQPLGAVVDRVHARHHGEEDLGRADVAGGLLPADVLLAGLQRQPVGGGAVGVDGHADEPSGKLPLEALGDRHVAACGPPNPYGTPNRCAEPTAMSAPDSPGGRSSVSASRSAATTALAPRSRARAIRGSRSRTAPDAPGYCSRTPKKSPSGSPRTGPR